MSRRVFKRSNSLKNVYLKRYIKGFQGMKKKYSIKELSTILGCSITAVQKKIIADENNPVLRRYKKRFDVVIEDGKSFILLDDEELEEEKRLSKGFKNVSKNVNEMSENVIDVEYTTETHINKDDTIDKVLKFTESYIERYETLQKEFYNLLFEKDNQIKLLTDSESKTQKEYIQISMKCKELEAKCSELNQQCEDVASKSLKRLIYVTIGFIIIIITLYFRFITF